MEYEGLLSRRNQHDWALAKVAHTIEGLLPMMRGFMLRRRLCSNTSIPTLLSPEVFPVTLYDPRVAKPDKRLSKLDKKKLRSEKAGIDADYSMFRKDISSVVVHGPSGVFMDKMEVAAVHKAASELGVLLLGDYDNDRVFLQAEDRQFQSYSKMNNKAAQGELKTKEYIFTTRESEHHLRMKLIPMKRLLDTNAAQMRITIKFRAFQRSQKGYVDPEVFARENMSVTDIAALVQSFAEEHGYQVNFDSKSAKVAVLRVSPALL